MEPLILWGGGDSGVKIGSQRERKARRKEREERRVKYKGGSCWSGGDQGVREAEG